MKKRFISAMIAVFAFCLIAQADTLTGRVVSIADPVAPWDFRHPAASPTSEAASVEQKEDPQEETVYITKSGKKYHRDGCRHLSKSKIAIKRKDAIARGYDPCSVCKP